jgi:hypothetical protein
VCGAEQRGAQFTCITSTKLGTKVQQRQPGVRRGRQMSFACVAGQRGALALCGGAKRCSCFTCFTSTNGLAVLLVQICLLH